MASSLARVRRRPSGAEYDKYLYSNFPYAETHPDRLATLGTLFGLRPTPPGRARVLELGCGLGGNLIGMAVGCPESTFLGIDQSARQVQVGQETIAALGLRNIQLQPVDILAFDAERHAREPFDYILCHGVFSWVPEPVQKKILHIAGSCLVPQGVAYVSYNTLPGWHMRGMLRDLLRRQAGTDGPVEERIRRARAFLSFLEQAPRERSPAHSFLRTEVQMLQRLGDEYLFYEHLVDTNRPLYFTEFAAAAERAGLQYLTDATFTSIFPGRLDIDVAALGIDREDVVAMEQAVDYLDVSLFRRSLLCHSEARLDRNVAWQQLQRFHVSSAIAPVPEDPDLRPGVQVDFHCQQDMVISTDVPVLKAAFQLLYQNRPRGLPFDELCAGALALLGGRKKPGARVREKIGRNLLELLELGYIELGLGTVRYAMAPGERPVASPLGRLQAQRGEDCATNLRHECLGIDDLDRALLIRMDGSRTIEELCRDVQKDVEAGHYAIEIDDEPVRSRAALFDIVRLKIEQLARYAFLLG